MSGINETRSEKAVETDSDIMRLASELKGLYDKAFEIYSSMVDSVLNNRVSKERDIERIMDGLLDYGEDPRFVELYKKLCRHVYNGYPKLVKEHAAIFIENHAERCELEERD